MSVREHILKKLAERPDGLAILARHRVTATQLRRDKGPEIEAKILALMDEVCLRDPSGTIHLPNFAEEQDGESTESAGHPPVADPEQRPTSWHTWTGVTAATLLAYGVILAVLALLPLYFVILTLKGGLPHAIDTLGPTGFTAVPFCIGVLYFLVQRWRANRRATA